MTDEKYRWVVRAKGETTYGRADYVREVVTGGPQPDEAIVKALKKITEKGEDDLWQNSELTVTVERVR